MSGAWGSIGANVARVEKDWQYPSVVFVLNPPSLYKLCAHLPLNPFQVPVLVFWLASLHRKELTSLESLENCRGPGSVRVSWHECPGTREID